MSARHVHVTDRSWIAELPGIGVSILVGFRELADEAQSCVVEELSGRGFVDELRARQDFEDLVSELGLIAGGILGSDGFDAVYEPAMDTEWRGEAASVAVWDQWKAHAAEERRPLVTCGDIVTFMTDLGMLEEIDVEGVAYWRLGNKVRKG